MTTKDKNDHKASAQREIDGSTGECKNEHNKEFCSKEDPAGTDPDRYKYISSGESEAKDDRTKDDYTKDANNSDPEDRMISPDRGN